MSDNERDPGAEAILTTALGHNGPRNHSTYSSEYCHRECVACQRGSPPRLLTSLREAESRWETRTSSWRSDKKAASIGHSTTSSSQRSDNNKSSYNRYSLLFYRVNQLFGKIKTSTSPLELVLPSCLDSRAVGSFSA